MGPGSLLVTLRLCFLINVVRSVWLIDIIHAQCSLKLRVIMYKDWTGGSQGKIRRAG